MVNLLERTTFVLWFFFVQVDYFYGFRQMSTDSLNYFYVFVQMSTDGFLEYRAF